MSDCYIGEVRAFPYTYIPEGWLLCDGTKYNVSQFQALASLLGDSFGGNWPNTFGVPDLRQRVAVSVGMAASNAPEFDFPYAQYVGEPIVSILNYPAHTHTLQKKNIKGGAAAKVSKPDIHSNLGQLTTATVTYFASSTAQPNAALAPQTLSPLGQSPAQPHENRQPYLSLFYAIAYTGEYPVPAD